MTPPPFDAPRPPSAPNHAPNQNGGSSAHAHHGPAHSPAHVPLPIPAPHRPQGMPPLPPVKEPARASSSSSAFVYIVLAVLLIGAGVGGYFFFVKGAAGSAAPQAAAPAPTPVQVRTVAEQKIRIWNQFSGRLRAVDYAEIRPQVSGRITEIHFQDGQSVKAGDILFVIDPRPFEDAVAKAEADVVSAQAAADFAKSELARATTLIAAHAIAQRDLDLADSANRAALSTLQGDQAALKTAQLDLDYAYVKAPISGRASRAEITVGNLVQSGPNAPLLTSIASQDGIYADFEVDEQTYMETIRNTASGNTQEQTIPVALVVPGDSGHLYKGFIQNFDNRIDSTSGTIRARARFANEDGALVPGMFVSVKLASSSEREAILIPERAIGSDQSKKFVFIVTDAGKVAYREVTLGQSVREERIVDQGLQAGDRVIVDGIQHIRPDAPVTPTEAPASSVAADDESEAPASPSAVAQNQN